MTDKCSKCGRTSDDIMVRIGRNGHTIFFNGIETHYSDRASFMDELMEYIGLMEVTMDLAN